MTTAFVAIHPRRATELSGPDDESVFEHPPLLEISEQTGDGLIDALGVLGVLSHVAVLIPVLAGTAVHQFDERHAAFRESAGDKTRPAEAIRLSALDTVQRMSLFRLLTQIEDVARLGLHVERGLESANAGGQFAVVPARLEMALIKRLSEAKFQFLYRALSRATVEIRNRFLPRYDAHALMIRGQEVVIENLRAGIGRTGGEQDERGQVLVYGTQSETDPGTDAGPLEK